MKKYIGMVLLLIGLISLTACISKKEIVLPEEKEITEIEIMENLSESIVKITEQNEIAQIINIIKENTKNTGKESVSDQPVNVNSFFIIKFYHKKQEGNPSIAYLYKYKDKAYVEQPYSGIWKLNDESFDSIISLTTNEASRSINKDVKNETDDSYKPMVKLNDKIYIWVRDLGEVKLGNMEFLGEIKYSKMSLLKNLNSKDKNLSSNIYPVGTKIYKWDEKSVLVEINDVFSVCEVIE
ncbi:DUF5301 domain-containing protein [Peptoniphilaceae bacterium SGI.131]